LRIGVDAMGGDKAPLTEIKGALLARAQLKADDRIILVGNEPVLREIFDQHDDADDWEDQIEIQHASQQIGMDENPVEALKSKPDSSLPVLVGLHAAGKIDACVSAGNTGAFAAAATVGLRKLSGVQRVGIAIVVPTLHGPVVVCDVGASVSCRPSHLHQYALMSSVFAEQVAGTASPRVGVLSVGEEKSKGNDLVKEAHELIKHDPAVHFIGNIESRDLFAGVCDVVVCDGFVGNVVLKLIEGFGAGLIGDIVRNIKAEGDEASQALAMKAVQETRRKYDFNDYGGAPLLGVGGVCMICHGASEPRGIANAIREAKAFANHRVNDRIMGLLNRQ
jgi:glycerol-3-phosphate acyltransferase PlsX